VKDPAGLLSPLPAATVTVNIASAPAVSELIATAYTASSKYSDGGWSAQPYTGLTATNGMRDGNFLAYASIHGTLDNSPAWIRADLGATKTIDHVDVAAIAQAMVDGWTPAEINGAVVQYSTNGTAWTNGPTISGVVYGSYKSVSLGSVSARYVRLYRASGYIGVGDFRIYGAP
ncbi:MAG TPA: discoidin domain-containing protein, partial [Caulobacter sp.]|nr:discoidin domain-containing protein [Caulobacter sp.]